MAYTKQNFQNGNVLTAAQLNAMEAQIAENESSMSALRQDMDDAFYGSLETEERDSVVKAVNELNRKVGGQWRGKSWYAFGTSLTDTDSINSEDGAPTGKYVKYLAGMSGLIPTDYGIAGGTIGKGGIHGGSANILDRIRSTDLSGADLITIEGFVNDFACAVAIGQYGDTDISGDTGGGESSGTHTLSDFPSTASKYIDRSGNVMDAQQDYMSVTEPIAVDEGDTIAYQISSFGTFPAIACYDSEGNHVSSASVVNSGDGGVLTEITGTMTVPTGVATVRVVFCHTRTAEVTFTLAGTGEVPGTGATQVIRTITDFTSTKSKIIDRDTGNVIDAQQDYYSVTEPISVTEGEVIAYTLDFIGTYPAIACYDASGGYMKAASVMATGDSGVLSSSAGTMTVPAGVATVRVAFCNTRTVEVTFTAQTAAATAHTVSTAAGVENPDTITMFGGITAAVKHCLENSSATVVLITESQGREYTLSSGQTVNYSTTRRNSLNLTQKDYNDVIIAVGRYLGVPVIDAGSRAGINECTPQYLADHIHHSELGGKQFAMTVWDELMHLHGRKDAEI